MAEASRLGTHAVHPRSEGATPAASFRASPVPVAARLLPSGPYDPFHDSRRIRAGARAQRGRGRGHPRSGRTGVGARAVGGRRARRCLRGRPARAGTCTGDEDVPYGDRQWHRVRGLTPRLPGRPVHRAGRGPALGRLRAAGPGGRPHRAQQPPAGAGAGRRLPDGGVHQPGRGVPAHPHRPPRRPRRHAQPRGRRLASRGDHPGRHATRRPRLPTDRPRAGHPRDGAAARRRQAGVGRGRARDADQPALHGTHAQRVRDHRRQRDGPARGAVQRRRAHGHLRVVALRRPPLRGLRGAAPGGRSRSACRSRSCTS